ncbi:MAG: class I SAM-dependent methyltransferase [Candidatus Aenigmarchaeota archaeon]|nr:class I SAM-dependent methyltransferase [Candidatus Aenigmarchaeota archaeon]
MKVRKGSEMIKKPKKMKSNFHTPLTEPSNSEMSVFARHMKNLSKGKKDARIIIMGASPEIRNIACKENICTTVVANDLEVIERTTKLMDKKNTKEVWLEGQITKLGLRKNSFDGIFGDHILSNTSPFNSDKFYERIKDLLKKDGLAVMRSVVFSKTEKLFEKRLSKHFKIVDKEFGKEGAFARHFPIYSMVPKK